LYVWFDAPIGYISASKVWSEETQKDWQPYWKNSDTKMVHFIGKDNIVFHCIIFPAMLQAEGSYILPENVPANEFMNLEDDKISTSRNWAVWLHEYLEDFKDKQDVLRYVLTSNAPETKDNNFTWKDFQTKNNSELLAIFGNFINRTIVLTHKFYQGNVPSQTDLTENDEEVLEQIKKYPELIGRSIELYHFRDALNELMNLARLGNKYLTDNEPWKTIKDNPQRVQTVMNIALQIAAGLAILCEPFLPFTAKRLQKMLRIDGLTWKDVEKGILLADNHAINEAELLFDKIEDDAIAFQLQKLEQSKAENLQSAGNTNLQPQKELISFDDFSKMDLRICEVLEAEKVPKTKKLLKLKVDTGIDKRYIVSGIAEYYNPEDLIGKKVLMLVNLQAREIKGIESQGMILMAENPQGELCIVSPDKNTENGSAVK
jgi:methionyl-tRNA synthetase